MNNGKREKKQPAVPTFSAVLADIERNSKSYDEEAHVKAIIESSKEEETDDKNSRALRLPLVVVLLLILVGAVAATLFLFIGISGANTDQEEEFDRTSTEVVQTIERALSDYVVAASYIQEASSFHNVTREEFRMISRNMKSTGLNTPMISHNPLITSSERRPLEEISRQYYAMEYPELNYTGIQGLEGQRIEYRSEQPYYFPSHLIEPIYGNEELIDFDLNSVPAIKEHIDRTLETWEPTLTSRVGSDASEYSVLLLHPGNPTQTGADGPLRGSPRDAGNRDLQGQAENQDQVDQQAPMSFTAIQIQITDLLSRFSDLPSHDTIYVYVFCEDTHAFLGGAKVIPPNEEAVHLQDSIVEYQPKITEQELLARFDGLKIREQDLLPLPGDTITWTIYVCAAAGSYDSETTIIVTAGVLLFVLCIALGAFIYGNIHRTNKLSKLENQAQHEKALLVVQNANKAAKRERDLNDFIAHEVRNPLAAAMSACSFVTSEVLDEKQPMIPPERYESVKEDFGIIDASLHFINDLLRNMLDMQRAGSKQLKIDKAPTHVMNDILRPVDAMLHRRGAVFDVLLECDDNLVVMTDSLRLKQIVLNLARNSIKFVERGFIRLKATTVFNEDFDMNTVRICVEDSGPGIPEEKRQQLFGKFQESLDSLHQGTGIGLSLCKQLTNLMGGRLWIDEDYDSGLFGCPGARFVVDLNIAPMEWNDEVLEKFETASSDGDKSTSLSTAEDNSDPELKLESAPADVDASTRTTGTTGSGARIAPSPQPTGKKAVTAGASSQDNQEEVKLPENLSVLFVDDDMVLRKLFSRSVRKVAPNWAVQEAGNGEAALSITKTEKFDVIFMDQYMASVQKQLLGTEATRALRAQGVTAKICGLSANDVEKSFLEAGADSFMMKPFPCKPDALRKELVRVVNTDRNFDGNGSQRSQTGLSSVEVWTQNV